MNFTNDGKEVLSQIPLSIPYDKTRPESLQEQIARMVRSEFSQMAHNNGEETFDEANDFGDEDDVHLPDAPLSPFQEDYSNLDMPSLSPSSDKELSSPGVDNSALGDDKVVTSHSDDSDSKKV